MTTIKLHYIYFPLFANKSFELQWDFGNSPLNPYIFAWRFRWTAKRDHAGLSFEFGIWKLFWLEWSVRDSRHWNYKEDRWFMSGEEIVDMKTNNDQLETNKENR